MAASSGCLNSPRRRSVSSRLFARITPAILMRHANEYPSPGAAGIAARGGECQTAYGTARPAAVAARAPAASTCTRLQPLVDR